MLSGSDRALVIGRHGNASKQLPFLLGRHQDLGGTTQRAEKPEKHPEQYSAIYSVLEMMNEASATEIEQPAH